MGRTKEASLKRLARKNVLPFTTTDYAAHAKVRGRCSSFDEVARFNVRTGLIWEITALIQESNWIQAPVAELMWRRQSRLNDLHRSRISCLSLNGLGQHRGRIRQRSVCRTENRIVKRRLSRTSTMMLAEQDCESPDSQVALHRTLSHTGLIGQSCCPVRSHAGLTQDRIESSVIRS